ncbi:MAG: sugar-binding domain-containing protein [Actinomycetaceae bacterium]|nr:sugar-binding domain-containing protein [Actinomycetaceae bacterium]MDY6082670.1 sugar-binding domain-containing protein [Actinomycetaceae bacterium]
MSGLSERKHKAYDVALLYYVEHATMESIARRMNLSRSTVSRLLSYAREAGLVRISMHSPDEETENTTSVIGERFGIRTIIVPVVPPVSEVRRFEKVASAAGAVISDAMESGMTMALAWGTTTSAIADYLVPKRTHDTTIVQIDGSSSARASSSTYFGDVLSQFGQNFGARVVGFPVPTFFDSVSTRNAVFRESSVIAVRDLSQHADIAVFGIGAFDSPIASHIYSDGYLTAREVVELRSDGVVGDVCGVLLREDGSWRDIEINRRATGLNPDELKQIPRRFGVAYGPAKAQTTLAALRAGTITDLVVDSQCASQIVELMRVYDRRQKNNPSGRFSRPLKATSEHIASSASPENAAF